MSIYSMFVINKSGGCIFNKDFADTARLDLNDVLRMASIW
ncbi:component of TRAPP complex, partial [Haematococcus lacustris]